MYGLVNKAIADMVKLRFGEDKWQQICKAAAVESLLLSMEVYPDDLTHRLVKASSEILGLTSAEIMQAFGEFWIQYTTEAGYGELLDMSGDDLPEVLENLDNLHTRLGVIFPKLKPPSFRSDMIDEQTLTLEYHSEREGLAPMVMGLVKGLGARLDTDVTIEQTKHREKGDDHDEFSIQHKPH
ncbi:heme NO-binding domain-containing protein [Calothrix sp. 336/3]|uniref:heme NO-binding domain-containing protein n=1 Tax=Calothrix sp. 336/3 TaxID=1337936 RepID=UPI0004E439AB|nr:heme NO-binding domain-containing protein [Calothrix sp. 336/3]AKG20914.1 heme NO-binding protein [Calothrix sp. 336/3]